MKYTVLEASSRRDLKRFVHFPNEMYKECKYYVPTIESGDLDLFDPHRNHAFEFCECKCWLVVNEKGEIVGRIAGIINREYNRKVDKKLARFGFMDFIDDDTVVDLLLDTVQEWALSKGMEYLNGPLGFLEFDPSGVLVEGFEELPTAYGKYNYQYYEKQLLRRGFSKDTDWVEFRILMPDVIPEAYARGAELISKRYDVHVDYLRNKRQLTACFDEMADLMNRCYSKIHGYSELNKGQIEDLKKQFTSILKPEFVSVIRNGEGRMVAFAVTAPSMAEALQKCGGKLFPFGFRHILKAMNHNDTLDCLLIGVDDQYKSKGVTSLIFDALSKPIKEYGIKYIESTRELEDNTSVHNLWNRFEYRLHKRARCYIKSI